MKSAERQETSAGDFPSSDKKSPSTLSLGVADVALLINSHGRVIGTRFADSSSLADALKNVEGLLLQELATPDSRDKVRAVLKGPHTDRCREINLLPPGSTRPIALRCAAQQTNDGVTLLCADLRPLAEAQERLMTAQQALERDYARMRAAETRYRALFQLSKEPMLIVDAQSRRVVEANAACLQAFNLPLSRIAGRSVSALFDEEDGEALTALITTTLAVGQGDGVKLRAVSAPESFETRGDVLRLDGATFVLLRTQPLASPTGPTSDQKLPQVMDKWPDAFVLTDKDGMIIEANQAFADLGELPALGIALGQRIDRWLGREGIDLGMLQTALKDFGVARSFPTVIPGHFGSVDPVEVTAIQIAVEHSVLLAFMIKPVRDAGIRAVNITAGPMASVEQMKSLIGKVPLKELVRDTTDVIERLCIEAALDMTMDNRASAAELLGLSRQSLYAKLHRFGLGDLSASDEA